MEKIKPMGVTLLCIAVSISMGIVPIVISITLLNDRGMSSIIGWDSVDFSPNLALSLGVIISAFFTWKGNIFAKRVLFLSVWLHVVGVILNSLSLLIDPSQLGMDSLDSGQKVKLYSNIVRSILWLVVMHGYFRTTKAKKYFEKSAVERAL